MFLQDWHTHNKLCRHAIGTLEDFVKEAIEIGLDLLGVSDHFPYEFLEGFEGIPYEEYAMTLEEIEDYVSRAEELREKYKDRINLKIGFEIEFVVDQTATLNRHLKNVIDRLDYILGSIHCLKGNRGMFCFDDTRFLEEYNNYGVDNIYFQYYQTMQKMITSKEFDFDIISHFDLPKKFNKFPENKELITNEILTTLELIKKRDLVVEINTGGFRKNVKEQYPSEEIIKIMYEIGIPVLLGSDAHSPSELAYEFERIIKLLKEIGYNELASFDKRKRNYVEI